MADACGHGVFAREPRRARLVMVRFVAQTQARARFSRRAPARRPIAVALASAIAYSIAVFGTTCSAFALPSDTRLDLARVVFAFAEECARASNARVHTVANAFFICVPHNLCLKARRANARPR